MKKRQPRRLRVIVADRNPTQRLLVKTALALDATMQVVADATSEDELVELAELIRPDVLVLDFDSVALLERVVEISPSTRAVIRIDEQLAARSEEPGVFLGSDVAPGQIVRAVREASRGKALSDRSVAVYPPVV